MAATAQSQDQGRSPLLDTQVFGRRVRAQRRLMGLDSAAELSRAVLSRTGLSVSERSLYMIENGAQRSSLEVFFALLMTLEPDGGLEYFKPAIARAAWQQLF